MSVLSFLDTNVLVYTDDGDAPKKKSRALDLYTKCRSERSGVPIGFEPQAIEPSSLGISPRPSGATAGVLPRGLQNPHQLVRISP